jgi:hypothetical protein
MAVMTKPASAVSIIGEVTARIAHRSPAGPRILEYSIAATLCQLEVLGAAMRKRLEILLDFTIAPTYFNMKI